MVRKAASYVEFFSGEANVFAQVKGAFPGVAVDYEYLKPIHGHHSNAFDINSPSGLALHVCMGFCSISMYRQMLQFWHNLFSFCGT